MKQIKFMLLFFMAVLALNSTEKQNTDLFDMTRNIFKEIEWDLDAYIRKISNNGTRSLKLWQSAFKNYVKKIESKYSRKISNLLKQKSVLTVSELAPLTVIDENSATFSDGLYVEFKPFSRDPSTISVRIISDKASTPLVPIGTPRQTLLHGTLAYAGKISFSLYANDFLPLPENTSINLTISVKPDSSQLLIIPPKAEPEINAEGG